MYVEYLSLLIAFICVCCDQLSDAALLSVWWLHMNDLISWSALRMSATFLSEKLKDVNEWKTARSGAVSSSDWYHDVFRCWCGATTLLHVTRLPPCGSLIQLLHLTKLLKKGWKCFCRFSPHCCHWQLTVWLGRSFVGRPTPRFEGV